MKKFNFLVLMSMMLVLFSAMATAMTFGEFIETYVYADGLYFGGIVGLAPEECKDGYDIEYEPARSDGSIPFWCRKDGDYVYNPDAGSDYFYCLVWYDSNQNQVACDKRSTDEYSNCYLSTYNRVVYDTKSSCEEQKIRINDILYTPVQQNTPSDIPDNVVIDFGTVTPPSDNALSYSYWENSRFPDYFSSFSSKNNHMQSYDNFADGVKDGYQNYKDSVLEPFEQFGQKWEEGGLVGIGGELLFGPGQSEDESSDNSFVLMIAMIAMIGILIGAFYRMPLLMIISLGVILFVVFAGNVSLFGLM
jgi:hypothetical protein